MRKREREWDGGEGLCEEIIIVLIFVLKLILTFQYYVIDLMVKISDTSIKL